MIVHLVAGGRLYAGGGRVGRAALLGYPRANTSLDPLTPVSCGWRGGSILEWQSLYCTCAFYIAEFLIVVCMLCKVDRTQLAGEISQLLYNYARIR